MKFSEYIVIEKPGGSVDPIGMLRPSTAIADNLFNQFTVLSNHPAYHGFLCFAFGYAAEKGIKPGKDFSRTFRDFETLWGILNCKADQSILNVTKYVVLAKRDSATLSEAHAYRDLYLRLNYGTLGHYSSPSIFWGLLNPKGTDLTALGSKLGDAWGKRKGQTFRKVLDEWMEGKDILESNAFQNAINAFHLESEPDATEKAIWRDTIAKYCADHPIVSGLWNNPVPAETLAQANEETTYSSFYAGMIEQYREDAELTRRIELAREFEILAACAQFIFEWEYANRSDEGRILTSAYGWGDLEFLSALPQRIRAYLAVPGHKDTYHGLFKSLGALSKVQALGGEVVRLHGVHQASKSASPFIREDEIVIRDRVDLESLSDLMQRLKERPGQWESILRWHYKRDWYFTRAAKWMGYAKEAA